MVIARRLAVLVALSHLGCVGPLERSKGATWVRLDDAVVAPAHAPRKFALIVGINEYEDARFGALRYAERDAEALAASLEGFNRVVRLTGEQTRRPVILAALNDLLAEANQATDTVVLYFSSHGSAAQRPGGGLERVIVTRDARMEVLLQTGLPIEELTRVLDDAASRRRLLVLALCHSGKGKSQLPDSLAKVLASQKGGLQLEARSESTTVLTACAFGESARENTELKHDIYTHFLLEGLERGDLDRDGAVTASEAHDYARERTFFYTQGQQRPTSESETLGIDPIVLKGRRQATPLPVLFSYSRSSEGLRLRVDGQDKGLLPGSATVEPGRRVIRIEDMGRNVTLFEGAVNLEAGERADLATVLPKPRAWSFALGALANGALSPRIRDDVVPLTAGAQLRVSLMRVGWQRFLLEGAIGLLLAQSSTPGLGLRLETQTSQVEGLLGVGAELVDSGRFSVHALLTGFATRIVRLVRAQAFVGQDAAWALGAGARVRARCGLAESVGVAAFIDLRATSLAFGAGRSWLPWGQLGLEVEWSPQNLE